MTGPNRFGTAARCRSWRHHGALLRLLPVVAMLAAAPPAAAQSLARLSLEDLMQMDAGQVFGASERLQPVTEAPASVSFITAQDIARYGYRTLADILRGVRGMYVTNDRNFSYLGTRGFGRPGDYNSRILLLINGHRVNDNIFGQAEIGGEFGLDPAMIQRVEVIRGPASSLYGDSAFFAVVNVITRSGASLGGAAVTLEAGTLGTELVRVSGGHELANGMDLALSATYEQSDGVRRLYFPVFDSPATNNGVAEGLDGEAVRQLYGKLMFKGLALTGAYGTRSRDVPTATIGTLFNQHAWREATTDRHALIDAVYGRSVARSDLTLRLSFDRFSYEGTYPYLVGPDGAPTSVGHVRGLGTRWTASAGVTRAIPGRQTVRAGVEFIDNPHQDQSAIYSNDTTPLFDFAHSPAQHAVYVQDEIKLGRRLIVNAGLRYDAYDRFSRVTPRAALIFMPSSAQSVKYLYGKAFRAPNEFERNTRYFGESVRTLRPESIDTHELVWEGYVNDRLRTSMSAYCYKADRLITPAIDDLAFLGLTYLNQGEVRAKGLELEAQVRLQGQSRAQASYAFQRTVDQQTLDEPPNSPHHVVKARISLPGPTRRSLVSVEAQYLSSRATMPREERADGFTFDARVPGAATVNLHVVHPVGRSWEIFGGLRNLFDATYLDPMPLQNAQEAIRQNGRTARIGLTWKLWQP